MPRFLKPPVPESLTPLIEGEEAKTFIVTNDNIVERKQKKETAPGSISGFCEAYTRFWTNKFVHRLFPENSLNVHEMHLPKNGKNESRMYSDYLPCQKEYLQKLQDIYTEIFKAQVDIKTLKNNNQLSAADKRFKQTDVQVKKFDGDILKQYSKEIDAIQTKMDHFGIIIRHPEINVIIAPKTNKLVFSEFKIATDKTKKAISKMTDQELKKFNLNEKIKNQLLHELQKIKIYQLLEEMERNVLDSLQNSRLKNIKEKDIKLLLDNFYEFLLMTRKLTANIKISDQDIGDIEYGLKHYYSVILYIKDLFFLKSKVVNGLPRLIKQFRIEQGNICKAHQETSLNNLKNWYMFITDISSCLWNIERKIHKIH